METTGFYNTNTYRWYPLEEDNNPVLSANSLPKEAFADMGVIAGIDSGYVVGTSEVYFKYLSINGNTVQFSFQSDAPGMSGYEFLFTRDMSSDPLWAVEFVTATDTVTGDEETDVGTAFLVTGDLSVFSGWGNGTYTSAGGINIEPTLIQSLVRGFVKSIGLGDEPRHCLSEDAWPFPEPSWSLCSQTPVAEIASGLIGHVEFRAGYNAAITADLETNEIEISGRIGRGDGEPCEDILIDLISGILSSEPIDCRKCGNIIATLNGRGADTRVARIEGEGILRIINRSSDLAVELDYNKVKCD